MNSIDLTRLSAIPVLDGGAHDDLSKGACVMEAVAYVAGEPWSDHPQCVCPVIGDFLRLWNDGLSDDERDTLLRPLISLVIGTRGNPALERRRAIMAVDWLVRSYTPAWLRLARLNTQASALENLPEITDFVQCPSLVSTLEAAQLDAAAAWSAARDAAKGAARDAAGDAAATAAWDAAWSAAWSAARDSLNVTRLELQQSALKLVHRMIAAGDGT